MRHGVQTVSPKVFSSCPILFRRPRPLFKMLMKPPVTPLAPHRTAQPDGLLLVPALGLPRAKRLQFQAQDDGARQRRRVRRRSNGAERGRGGSEAGAEAGAVGGGRRGGVVSGAAVDGGAAAPCAVRVEDVRDGGGRGHGRRGVVGARRRGEQLRGVGPAGARRRHPPALLQARQLRVLHQAAQHLRTYGSSLPHPHQHPRAHALEVLCCVILLVVTTSCCFVL